MKLFIAVKPNAKVNSVERIDDNHFRVSVKAPPKDGKANQAVIQALSDYFNVPKSRFSLLRGDTSKIKTVEMSS